MLILMDQRWLVYIVFALAITLVLSLLRIRKERKLLKEFSDYLQMKNLGKPRTLFSEARKVFLSLAIVAGLGLVLSDPRWKTTEKYEEKEPLLFSLWLDNSLSMLARDVLIIDKADEKKISRKEMIVAETRNFVGAADIDRIGLGIFADKAYSVLPLLSANTPHFKRIFFEELDRIEGLDPNLMVQGTNFGWPVWRALEGFGKKTPYKKVIIILTDGEQQGEQEELSAVLAQAIRLFLEREGSIYLVGVGNPQKESLIPKTVRQGEIGEYLTLPSGNFIKTKPDFVFLAEMARSMGGKFFPATTGKDLKNAIKEIVKERRVVEVKERVVYYDMWQYILLIVVAAMFLINPRIELI